MSDRIEPFRIAASDEQLAELRRRLRTARFPERECVDDWSQGIPLAYVQDVCAYWAEKYDWRDREARLNRFPQFKTELDGVSIHFVHARSPHADAMPLVISHGWPGSIVEFHKVIEPLTNPTAHGGDASDAFHVVCPSLPGYGFSSKPSRAGWNVQRIARAWSQLMPRLGYRRYAAQGGDWGAMVTTCIGIQDPENCLGIHLNMPIAPPDPATMGDLTDKREVGARRNAALQRLGLGLLEAAEHAPADGRLRPNRFSGRTGGLDPGEVLGVDRLQRPPRERADARRAARQRDALLAAGERGVLRRGSTGRASAHRRCDPITIPVGCSIFPKEIFRTSRRWAEKRFAKLVHFNELEKGGHFAAFEQPEAFVREVRECFRKLR